jgi:ABC-type nitrate/sulfonate/bicarbonate transport system permease component
MEELKQIFLPFGQIRKSTRIILVVVWLVFLTIMAAIFHNPLIPSPVKIFSKFLELIQSSSLWVEFISSIEFTFKAMFYSLLITMLLTYLAVIPMIEPIAVFVSKCRYLTLSGVIFLFTVLSGNVSNLKMSLLLFGIIPFFLTSALGTINPVLLRGEINKAMINKKTRWETVWEVLVVGKLDVMIEILRQNFAMAWLIIIGVEGLAMSEGGLGTLFIKAGRVLEIDKVFSLLLIVLLTGVLIDFLLKLARQLSFPYLPKN